MIPNFTIGDNVISAYMIMTVIGIFAAGCFSISKVKGEEEKLEFLCALLWSGVGLVIGGHLLFGITNIEGIIDCIANNRGIKTFISYFSGNVFYGGLLGGLGAFLLYFRIKKLNYKEYLDQGALFVPFFHCFGRVGCFLSGCCYGVESSIGFVYHHSLVEAANGVRRFPIQLVEAGLNLLLFFLLWYLFKKEKLQQRLLYLYFLIYPIIRFTLEFFRGDSYRGFLFGLSTSQLISILLFLYAVIMLVVTRKKEAKS